MLIKVRIKPSPWILIILCFFTLCFVCIMIPDFPSFYVLMPENPHYVQTCSRIPPNLQGYILYSPIRLDLSAKGRLQLKERLIIAAHKDVSFGGQWSPDHCRSLNRISVIIPFRNRSSHLLVLLDNLLPVLKRQLIQFRIFVVEQAGNGSFNKGRLMNIGYQIVKDRYGNFSRCIIFHDVDLIPEDDRNMYTCAQWPKHMSPSVSTLNYELPYEQLVGGVLAISDYYFEKANGFSNLYFGWGGEDDDFYYRLQHQSIEIIRPPSMIGRYKMLLHNQRHQEMTNLQLLRTVTKRYKYDGLSQLKDYKYRVLDISLKNLYTHFLIDVGFPNGNGKYRAYSIGRNNYNYGHKNYNQPMMVGQDEKLNIQTKIAHNLYAFIEKESQNRLTIQKLKVLMKAREIIIDDENKL